MNTTQASFRARNVLGILGLLSLCSCASIVDGGRRKVHIDSNPSGAQVTIYNRHDEEVDTDTTPFVAKLQRKSGFFKGEEYRLVFELAGYQKSEARIASTLNPWYFGNIGFGGVIGLFIVDPWTGAMWNLSPKKMVEQLEPVATVPGGTGTNDTVAPPKQETAPSEQPQPQPAPTEQPKTETESATNGPPQVIPATNEPPVVPSSAPKE